MIRLGSDKDIEFMVLNSSLAELESIFPSLRAEIIDKFYNCVTLSCCFSFENFIIGLSARGNHTMPAGGHFFITGKDPKLKMAEEFMKLFPSIEALVAANSCLVDFVDIADFNDMIVLDFFFRAVREGYRFDKLVNFI